VPDDGAFAALMDDLSSAPWVGEVGAVLSGYLGSADQAQSVARLVSSLKNRNPVLRYVCDPVIGDSGGLYVPEALATAIRDRLLPLADIATPNRYELQWIVQAQLDTARAVMEAALMTGPPMTLVTSAPAMMAGGIGNLLVTPSHAWLAEHRMIEHPPNGLGDLTAAVFLARLMAGEKPDKALQSTTASVFEILARTAKRGADELQIETDAGSLSHPMAMVQMRQLMHPSRDRRA
jgi:pyridoxine kinase